MGIDLSGILIPAASPFDPVTGDIDVVGMRSNIRRWMDTPVSGVVIAGSTGESLFLDEDERVRFVGAAREVIPDDRLLVAGTGLESTRATIRLSRAAAEAGADTVLVQPPAYYKGAMTPEVLREHYVAVADACPVPVIVYQVPLRLSTLDLPTGLVAELSTHENIVGIKDSRGTLDLVGDLVQQCQEGFQVLVGSGALLYAALVTGAVGGILGVANLAPTECAEIYRTHEAGRSAESGRLQDLVTPVHNGVVGGMGVAGVKAGLDLLGYRGGSPRKPLGPLSSLKMIELKQLLGKAGLLVQGGEPA
jgi:4-hydroxy-2-oxoglutarate aldolase